MKIDFLPLTEPRPILRSRFREAMACRPRKEKGIGCPDCPKIPKFSQKKVARKSDSIFDFGKDFFCRFSVLGLQIGLFPIAARKRHSPSFFFANIGGVFVSLPFPFFFIRIGKGALVRGRGKRYRKRVVEMPFSASTTTLFCKRARVEWVGEKEGRGNSEFQQIW